MTRARLLSAGAAEPACRGAFLATHRAKTGLPPSLAATVIILGPTVVTIGSCGGHPVWKHVASDAPAKGRVIYFEPLDELLLFSSEDPDAPWSWSGHSWTQRRVNSIGPPILYHSMLPFEKTVYDIARSVAVSPADLPSVYEWGHWGQLDCIESTEPCWRHVVGTADGEFADSGNRLNYQLAYDVRAQRATMYRVEQTWEWDGASWHLAAEGAGPAVKGSAMTYSDAEGRIVSFGGEVCVPGRDSAMCVQACPAETRIINDWQIEAYCGETMGYADGDWQVLTTDGPRARAGSAMAYHPRREKVILYGGRVQGDDEDEGGRPSKEYLDTWAWNGESWRRLATESGPGECCGFQMVYHEGLGKMLLYDEDDGELWEMVEDR